MKRTTFHAMSVVAGAAIFLAGCTKTESQQNDSAATAATATPAAAATGTAGANMVMFSAKEFAFDGPAEIPAGLTMFHLIDAGQELHHVQLLKLEQGKTFADLEAAVKAGGPPPMWAVPYGGVNPGTPGGGETSATQVMEPGNYAVVCFIESADHVPHIAKGMMKPLTVTASANANTTEPAADVTMALNDYSFTLTKPLAAGKQLIKVQNDAAQPHEVVLVQLAPGKTIEELGAWAMDMKGPPPGKTLGGVPAIVKGKAAYFEANLEPGDYGLICFVPDAKDGKPHFTRGMAQQFKVS